MNEIFFCTNGCIIAYPANINVLVQPWSSVGNVAVSFQEKHTMAQRLTSVSNIAVGFQHYADGKPSVHCIGCNDSTNNLVNI